MSTTTTADAVHLDEDAITAARFVVSMEADDGGIDCFDWPATVQILGVQRRWADIADALHGRPVPLDVAKLLRNLRDDEIVQIEGDKESRQRFLDGDADYGVHGMPIEDMLAQYDRQLEDLERSITGCDSFLAAVSEATA